MFDFTDSMFEIMNLEGKRASVVPPSTGFDDNTFESVLTNAYDEGLNGSGSAISMASTKTPPDVAAGSIHGDHVDLLSNVIGVTYKTPVVRSTEGILKHICEGRCRRSLSVGSRHDWSRLAPMCGRRWHPIGRRLLLGS